MRSPRTTASDTRGLAQRMAEEERAQRQKVSGRQFVISLAAILLALTLFAVFLILI